MEKKTSGVVHVLVGGTDRLSGASLSAVLEEDAAVDACGVMTIEHSKTGAPPKKFAILKLGDSSLTSSVIFKLVRSGLTSAKESLIELPANSFFTKLLTAKHKHGDRKTNNLQAIPDHLAAATRRTEEKPHSMLNPVRSDHSQELVFPEEVLENVKGSATCISNLFPEICSVNHRKSDSSFAFTKSRPSACFDADADDSCKFNTNTATKPIYASMDFQSNGLTKFSSQVSISLEGKIKTKSTHASECSGSRPAHPLGAISGFVISSFQHETNKQSPQYESSVDSLQGNSEVPLSSENFRALPTPEETCLYSEEKITQKFAQLEVLGVALDDEFCHQISKKLDLSIPRIHNLKVILKILKTRLRKLKRKDKKKTKSGFLVSGKNSGENSDDEEEEEVGELPSLPSLSSPSRSPLSSSKFSPSGGSNTKRLSSEESQERSLSIGTFQKVRNRNLEEAYNPMLLLLDKIFKAAPHQQSNFEPGEKLLAAISPSQKDVKGIAQSISPEIFRVFNQRLHRLFSELKPEGWPNAIPANFRLNRRATVRVPTTPGFLRFMQPEGPQ